MNDAFYKFLSNEIDLNKLENIIYQNQELENQIGDTKYQYLVEFSYGKKNANLEMQNFLFSQIVDKEEFADWYSIKLLNQNQIELPSKNTFLYAKENPTFLLDKTLKCNHYWTKKDIEIIWFNRIIEIKKENETFFCLGSFENDYVGIMVNEKDEIWFNTFIDEKFYFGGVNMIKAISKLLFEQYY